MSPVTRAKLDLIFSVAVFGTIGIFVRSIPLPSSVIALVRGAVGAAFCFCWPVFDIRLSTRRPSAASGSCWCFPPP